MWSGGPSLSSREAVSIVSCVWYFKESAINEKKEAQGPGKKRRWGCKYNQQQRPMRLEVASGIEDVCGVSNQD